jgi:hypothetical protein
VPYIQFANEGARIREFYWTVRLRAMLWITLPLDPTMRTVYVTVGVFQAVAITRLEAGSCQEKVSPVLG